LNEASNSTELGEKYRPGVTLVILPSSPSCGITKETLGD
jgi:hypothetical protein